MSLLDSENVQTTNNQDDLNQRLSAIRDSYSEKLPEKLDQVERLWNKLRYFNWTDDGLKVFYSIVHTLAGNGKTFGYQNISDICNNITEQLQNHLVDTDIPNTEKQNQISKLVEELIKSVSDIPTEAENLNDRSAEIRIHSSLQRHLHTVYVVDDDKHIADFLATQIESSAYKVEAFYNINDALHRIKENCPSALIMDIMFPGSNDMQGILAAEQIKDIAGKKIPTIYISARNDMTARLGALRASGNAFFNKPISSDKLIAKLDELILTKKYIGRIAIIDDDELLAERNAVILAKYHYETCIITQPLHALEQIQHFKPDLILMDIRMPDINGLELAQIIKQIDAFITTPILFLSGDKSAAVKQASSTISGDEFLSKDITQNELLHKIHSRLVNASIIKSQLKTISKTDASTGLANRKYFFNRLEKLIAEASVDSNLFLLQLGVDHFDLLSKQIGVLNLDDFFAHIVNTISEHLTATNVACQINDQSIAILFSDELQMVIDIATSMIQTLSSHAFTLDSNHNDFTVSIGLVAIDAQTTHTEQIFTQADQALAQAQAQGGNQLHQYMVEEIDDSSVSLTTPDFVSRIFKAVEQERFKLVFQPIIGMGDQQDEYYEVLLRLIDEQGKLYLPRQFFPVIKQNNTFHELDRWVIENTLAIYEENPKVKIRGNFFIKLSGESLSKSAFSIWVNNCINSICLLGNNRITFEIPEADILTRSKDTKKFITHLPQPTCQFAIDHFGSTDYSLQLLEDFKVDCVKLSGALVNKILTDNETSNHVQKLIKAAQEANVAVIAGALEDPKTLTRLWAWGVRHFQGYFIHSPNDELNYDFSENNQSIE